MPDWHAKTRRNSAQNFLRIESFACQDESWAELSGDLCQGFSGAQGPPQCLKKSTPRVYAEMKLPYVAFHDFQESLQELFREYLRLPRVASRMAFSESFFSCGVVLSLLWKMERKRSTAARGGNARGGTRLRGPEVWGPSGASEFDPLVSAVRGLGNPLPKDTFGAPERLSEARGGCSGASERCVCFQRSGKIRWATQRPIRGPVFPNAL